MSPLASALVSRISTAADDATQDFGLTPGLVPGQPAITMPPDGTRLVRLRRLYFKT